MSLVCHTIASRHSPENDKTVEEETADNMSWESTAPVQRLHVRPAPSFVPAALDYDEFGMPMTSFPQPNAPKPSASSDVSLWYRNLTARTREKLPAKAPMLSTSDAPLDSGKAHKKRHKPESASKNLVSSRVNWFSSTPLRSQDAASPSTLADLLKRNPPPLPSQPAFTPPVFLFIGPSNKGFNMLQRRGWEEGEGLGSGRIERKGRQGIGMKEAFAPFHDHTHANSRRSDAQRPTETRETIDLTLSESEHVIDLTLSDDETDSIPVEEEIDESKHEHHGMTLITPIATVLKADKLGVGLKRRRGTEVKAITHSPSAIAAHIKGNKEARKRLKERYGRGSKGLGRAKRKEEAERVRLLAYLNS